MISGTEVLSQSVL